MAPGGPLPQNTAGILDTLPSDVLAKVQQLGEMLQQDIKEGKITEAQIQRELMSGNLQQTIKSMNPEASQLLDEINASLKNSPNAENLPDLLGGLTGPHSNKWGAVPGPALPCLLEWPWPSGSTQQSSEGLPRKAQERLSPGTPVS